MTTATRGYLYTVRELDGLTTTAEHQRLYDWQAREILTAITNEPPETVAAVIDAAARTGAGKLTTATHSLLVLSAAY